MTRAPRTLRDLSLLEEYRSDRHDLGADLFTPCLRVSVSYDRAVGYFTSSGLQVAARGLEAFAQHGGSMRLVASPVLTEEDVSAIERGIAARDDIVARALLRQLANEEGGTDRRLGLLSWLIAEGRLVVRIALARRAQRGIFHEKVGLFTDADGNRVAVSGSANETRGGLVDNFEAVDVFSSWDATCGRVQRKWENFEALWEDRTANLHVLSFPEAVRQELLRLIPPSDPKSDNRNRAVPVRNDPIPDRGTLRVPEGVLIRSYQAEGIDAWEANDRHGILAMATGSGKTITSLAALVRLREEVAEPVAVVIAAPYVHLVDQWARVASDWGLRALRCYGSEDSWRRRVTERCDLFLGGGVEVLLMLTTHATLSLPSFQAVMARLPGDRTFIVADEVHHLGTDAGLESLPRHFRFRLGISATPERWEDPIGSRRLRDFFGDVVFEFDIRSAIEAGVLCHYEYVPTLVDLTPDELEEYEQITRSLTSELTRHPDRQDRAKIQRLMLERSLILDTAAGKLEALRAAITTRRPSWTLIYCANRSQLSAVMHLMWDRGIGARQFTGEEDVNTRTSVLDDLAAGSTPALVAMKCLDEGVDVPQARSAYLLASSANPMEYVQRRGRLLRPFEGKSKARIVDFVAIPDGSNEIERQLIRKEVRRVAEFASAADNRSRALEMVWPILKANGLLDEVAN